jgi:hypothetical protein
VRQGASSARGAFAGGAHFIGHEAREAEPSVVDAIIAVRAFFDRATMALVGKQLLPHDAAEFAILADIAETVQIQPFGSPAGMLYMGLQTTIGYDHRTLATLASLVKGERDGVFRRSQRAGRPLDMLEPEKLSIVEVRGLVRSSLLILLSHLHPHSYAKLEIRQRLRRRPGNILLRAGVT